MARIIRTRHSSGQGGYVKVSGYINEAAILEQANEELLDYDTKLEIMQLMAELMDPYVPYLHGPLSTTVEVSSSNIVYNMPYARRQFYGDNFNFTRDTHPLARAHWDEVIKVGGERREEFEDRVKEIIMRRAKEVYG